MRLSKVVLWAIAIFLATVFVYAGASKLVGPSAAGWQQRFVRWGYPPTAHYVVGLVEIVGGIGLLVPSSRRAAAAILVVVMVGALCTHVARGEFPRVIPPFVLGALACVLCFWRLDRGEPRGRL